MNRQTDNQKKHKERIFIYICTNIHHSVCPGSSDPFYILTYYKKGSLLPGHTVCNSYVTAELRELKIKNK